MYTNHAENLKTTFLPDDVIDYLCEDPTTPDKLRALMRIIEIDEELMEKVPRYIDIESKNVDWYSVFNMNYRPSAYAGLVWAKSLWDAKIMDGKDIFRLSFDMNEKMKKAVLDATNFAWDTNIFIT